MQKALDQQNYEKRVFTKISWKMSDYAFRKKPN